jgi:hypothetical protein
MRKIVSVPSAFPEDEDRREVTSAWDEKFDPHYGSAPQGQSIDSKQTFANLRDDMNDRRRQTARRVEGRRYF